MSLNVQFELMIYATIYGLFIGITYDCLVMLKEPLINNILDMVVTGCFWLLHVPLTLLYLSNVNDGIFHLYILIFFMLGAFSYFTLLRHKFRQDLEKLGECVFVMIRFLEKILNLLVISPILFIYKLLSDIINMFLRFLKLTIYKPFVKLTKRVFKQKKVRKRGKKANTGDGQQ